jgi:hypothetical protein
MNSQQSAQFKTEVHLQTIVNIHDYALSHLLKKQAHILELGQPL